MAHRTERNVVSQKMRDMGLLKLKLCQLSHEIKSLSDALDPKYFPLLLQAVQELSKLDKETGDVGIVGMAYRISQGLNKCLKIS